MFNNKLNVDYKYCIKKATDRNIVVYDSDATSGKFTKRLIALMKTVHRRQSGSNLTHIILSAEGFYDLAIDLNIKCGKMYTQFLGVYIQGTYDMGFSDNGGVLDYYLREMGGSLPGNDTEIAIGLAEKEKREEFRYIIGSY